MSYHRGDQVYLKKRNAKVIQEFNHLVIHVNTWAYILYFLSYTGVKKSPDVHLL